MKTINITEAMRLFILVAETGGFSAAARREGVQQSSVSRAIALLEEEYKTTLFHRTTRSLKITEQGLFCLNECRRIVQDIDMLSTQMQQSRELPEGRLRISLPVAFGSRVIVKMLGGFSRKFPKIALEIHLEDREVNLVSEGYDVVVRVGPTEDSTVICRKIGVIRRGLYVARSLRQKLGKIQSPQDLARFPAVVFGDVAPTRPRWVLSRRGERKTVPISQVTVVNHLDSLDALMEQGMGVACLPHYFNSSDLRAKSKALVDCVLPEWEVSQEFGASSAVYLLFPKGDKVSAKVRAFVDYLSESLASGC
jgi:DNA-binding transcriptional LysR family regulator